MAASKENPNHSFSSSSHRQSLCFASSLRAPLSPVHQNCLLPRFDPSTPSSRRLQNRLDLQKPVIPSAQAVVPWSPPRLNLPCPIPRTPLPTPAARRYLKDEMNSVSRSRAVLKDRFAAPSSTSGSNNKCSMPAPPLQWKRQTQLFLPKTTSQDSISIETVSMASEPNDGDPSSKSCRRKWRRYSRESVLRSLRGEANIANDREVRSISDAADVALGYVPSGSAQVKLNENKVSSAGEASKIRTLAVKDIANVRSIPATDLLSRYRVANQQYTGDGDTELRCAANNVNRFIGYVLPPLDAISEETLSSPLSGCREESPSLSSVSLKNGGNDSLTIAAKSFSSFTGPHSEVVDECACTDDNAFCDVRTDSPPQETITIGVNAEEGDGAGSDLTLILPSEEALDEEASDATLAAPLEETISPSVNVTEDFLSSTCFDDVGNTESSSPLKAADAFLSDDRHGVPVPDEVLCLYPKAADAFLSDDRHGAPVPEEALFLDPKAADAFLSDDRHGTPVPEEGFLSDLTATPLLVETLSSPSKPVSVYADLTLTPTCDKSAPPPDNNLTPPMQATQSPDFIKRDGMRALLPIDGKCYAAPCAMVQDRRKCKPRAVLTVDGAQDPLSSADSVGGSCAVEQSAHNMPLPSVASVEWMLDEKKSFGDGPVSPDIMSRTSEDLCRMSFPRIMSPQLEPLSVLEADTCKDSSNGKTEEVQVLQASTMSVLCYEWGASSSSSQGIHSRFHRTELSSACFNRSTGFDEAGEQVIRMEAEEKDGTLAIYRSCVVNSDRLQCTSYDDLNKSSVAASLKVENVHESSCDGLPPTEDLLSVSGSLSSSFSSQHQELDAEPNVAEDSVETEDSQTKNGSLVCFQGNQDNMVECIRALGIPAELYHHAGSGNISSRIAMARFLCNMTATYLDDIASCLENGSNAAVDSSSMTAKEWLELDSLRHDPSSMLAGQRKMKECCSLLRDLALQASDTRDKQVNSKLH